jgi:DNA uptake protein ComE-like DNA-binding protein
MTLIAGQTTDAPETPPLVDINSAPVEQIEAIVQNEALAAKIVEGRPYANKRQLLTRNLVTSEEYEKIQNRIIARQVQQNP